MKGCMFVPYFVHVYVWLCNVCLYYVYLKIFIHTKLYTYVYLYWFYMKYKGLNVISILLHFCHVMYSSRKYAFNFSLTVKRIFMNFKCTFVYMCILTHQIVSYSIWHMNNKDTKCPWEFFFYFLVLCLWVCLSVCR